MRRIDGQLVHRERAIGREPQLAPEPDVAGQHRVGRRDAERESINRAGEIDIHPAVERRQGDGGVERCVAPQREACQRLQGREVGKARLEIGLQAAVGQIGAGCAGDAGVREAHRYPAEAYDLSTVFDLAVGFDLGRTAHQTLATRLDPRELGRVQGEREGARVGKSGKALIALCLCREAEIADRNARQREGLRAGVYLDDWLRESPADACGQVGR